MKSALFRKLLSIDEVKSILAKNYVPKPVGTEIVSISEAYNRVLADAVVSPYDIPPFDRSTVDGYVVKAADTFGAEENHPTTLELVGKVNVGETPKVKVGKGTLAEIVTGAPIPEGADAVVMIEYTARRGNSILIRQAVSTSENLMKAGSDIRKGETVLTKRTVLTPHEIGVLAAIGSSKVKVFKRPKAAIFSTGAEIVEPGKPLTLGKIFDINAHALSAAVAECGGEPLNMGLVQDEAKQMRTALQTALRAADVVITSGGVSVGPTDIIPKVLDRLGKPGMIVYGIAVKPGKPTTIAVVNNKPIFSLPGHPTSALLIFHLFARPTILRMTGREEEEPAIVKAVLSERLFQARGRRTYITVTLKKDRAGRFVASPATAGLSGAITTLAKADGFTVIHEKQQFVEKGTVVEVELFKPSTYYSLARRRVQ